MKTPYRAAGRDDLHALTGSYALDALTDPERDAFERHLQHCGSCDAEVRGLREAAARLAMARAVDPPERMWQRVLASTYRTRQLPPPVADRIGRRAQVVGLVSGRRAAPARHPHVPRAIAAAVAACAAAAIAFGVVSQVTAPPRPPAAISSVLGARDAQTETMRTAAGGTVTVTVSWDKREAVVTTAGLSSLPSAQVYQLWVMSPAGTSGAPGAPGSARSRPVRPDCCTPLRCWPPPSGPATGSGSPSSPRAAPPSRPLNQS